MSVPSHLKQYAQFIPREKGATDESLSVLRRLLQEIWADAEIRLEEQKVLDEFVRRCQIPHETALRLEREVRAKFGVDTTAVEPCPLEVFVADRITASPGEDASVRIEVVNRARHLFQRVSIKIEREDDPPEHLIKREIDKLLPGRQYEVACPFHIPEAPGEWHLRILLDVLDHQDRWIAFRSAQVVTLSFSATRRSVRLKTGHESMAILHPSEALFRGADDVEISILGAAILRPGEDTSVHGVGTRGALRLIGMEIDLYRSAELNRRSVESPSPIDEENGKERKEWFDRLREGLGLRRRLDEVVSSFERIALGARPRPRGRKLGLSQDGFFNRSESILELQGKCLRLSWPEGTGRVTAGACAKDHYLLAYGAKLRVLHPEGNFLRQLDDAGANISNIVVLPGGNYAWLIRGGRTVSVYDWFRNAVIHDFELPVPPLIGVGMADSVRVVGQREFLLLDWESGKVLDRRPLREPIKQGCADGAGRIISSHANRVVRWDGKGDPMLFNVPGLGEPARLDVNDSGTVLQAYYPDEERLKWWVLSSQESLAEQRIQGRLLEVVRRKKCGFVNLFEDRCEVFEPRNRIQVCLRLNGKRLKMAISLGDDRMVFESMGGKWYGMAFDA
jgi:hypothetical protein